MTVQATSRTARFVGDGVTTSFPFAFKVFDAADLVVILAAEAGNETILTRNTHYTVSLNGDQENSPGGAVTVTAAPAVGETLIITTDEPAEQLTELTNASGFFPKTLEQQLDYLTILVQKHEELLRRAVQVSAVDTAPGVLLPAAALRANKYLTFDANGDVAIAVPLEPGSLTADNWKSVVDAEDVGAVLYPRTAAEIAAGVTPTNYEYPPYNVLRYGADPTGVADSSAAFQVAINAAIAAKATVVVPDGTYKWENQVKVEGSVDWWQPRAAVINSHVTGSVDGYDTDGFALVLDGVSESNWHGLHIDFTNGTAGVVMRCRNDHTRRNTFYGWRIDGGDFNTSRHVRTKIALRIIGNENGAAAAGNQIYFNRFIGFHALSAWTLVDLVKGDGDASTSQPNGQVFVAPVYEDFISAIDAEDTDEVTVTGGWWQLASSILHGTNITGITQSNGVATVTHTAHGYETGDIIVIAGASPSEYNGAKRITVVDPNTYTFSVPPGTASPATGTITARFATTCFRGQTSGTRLHGILDMGSDVGALPYFMYDGSSTFNAIELIQFSGVGGTYEDDTEQGMESIGTRIQGLRRISDRPHSTNGGRDIDIFGTGTNSHNGAGRSRVRIWNNLGSTRNISVGFKDSTTVSIAAAVTGTDISLDTASGEIARLDDSEGALVLASGKRFGFVNSQTTVGAAGGASALPATPTGYLPIKVGSTEYVIPYYAKS